jgi:hypothetical protein
MLTSAAGLLAAGTLEPLAAAARWRCSPAALAADAEDDAEDDAGTRPSAAIAQG